MRKVLMLFACLLGCYIAQAQTLSITGTITDSLGQSWNNGTFSAFLYSPNGAPSYLGSSVPTATFNGTLSGAGALISSGQFYNTNTITPTGALYVVTVCSNTSAPCSTFTIPTTSGSQVIASINAAITPPTYPAGPFAYGYQDSDVSPIPIPGGQYFNVGSLVDRVWNGSAWQNAGSGSGATLPFPGVIYGTSATAGTVATSSQVLAAYSNTSTTFFINNASTYTGTPDGTEEKPFLTVASAFAAMTQAAPYTVIFIGGHTYGEAGFTWPTNPTAVTIFGNQSTYTIISGSVTATAPISIYEWTLSGTFNFSAGTVQSRYWGGTISGNTTVTGNMVFHGTRFTGANVINVSATSTAIFDGSTIAGQIVSLGSGATVTVKGHSILTTAISQPNINMSAGGMLNVFESQLTNGGAGANINCADGATSANPNLITAGTSMNNGISCGSAYTLLSLATIIPSQFGSTQIFPTGRVDLGTGGTINVTGCSLTSPVGGSSAGQFVSGVTGTCTVTITLGYQAPNCWFAEANDLTTTPDSIRQQSCTTTTAVITGSTLSGDVVNFKVTPY